MNDKLKIGDLIHDIEDGDCYFEGVVTEVNTFGGVKTYEVTKVFWSGINEKEDDYLGQVIQPKWWYIKKVEI